MQMNNTADTFVKDNSGQCSPVSHDDHDLHHIQHVIDHVAHFLPAQGPIEVFVHHNTLHSFEDLPFNEGVTAGAALYSCNAYLPEHAYREKLEQGRIRLKDLESVLLDDLGDEADSLVAVFGTRFALRLAMLQYPLRSGPPAELRWVIAETDALRRFREDVPPPVRKRIIADTSHWVMRDLRSSDPSRENSAKQILSDTLSQFNRGTMESWTEKTWEAFVLNFLWRVCQNGVRTVETDASFYKTGTKNPTPLRELFLAATGVDVNVPVNEQLIRFCSVFLDQGFASWELPNRDSGFYRAFLSLYRVPFASPTRWLTGLKREVRRLLDSKIGPLESIDESLSLLGLTGKERDAYLKQSLLALRGWAGMVWQMESNAEWMPKPAPPGSLVEYVAVRLILERLAVISVARESLGFTGELQHVREAALARLPQGDANGLDQRAFIIFQIAQVRGWNPEDLQHLTREQWTALIREIDAFPALERRRVFHLAFERKYRNETLDAIIAHSKQTEPNEERAPRRVPRFQVVCCIDEREESFRRHLEEVAPDCETFGIAGFFGVAMYYRGAADAHFKPLCPVSISPQHYVIEEPLSTQAKSGYRRAKARRRLGQATKQAHRGTRTFLGGLAAGLLGSLAAFPLVARVLFPRTAARIRRMFGRIVQAPITELRLERVEADPGPSDGHIGYTIDEMASIVEGGLQALGLANVELLSRLVVICGHGSASLNNPHEAAHDCGACGGGRGGPNARAFAQMANDLRVRRLLSERGINVSDDTIFVGSYHNTCDDSVTWYDVDRVSVRHRALFEIVKAEIDEARKRSAHERCRRFESAELSLSVESALRHVEGRAEDLSQTRPEYGHATNALCFVGRRDWSRGLFLDRRAFLTSYDPAQDDERSSVLEKMLQAVIPVCAGINLEYYFSFVDPTGYGCGTKLPHNITSLLGVMDGAASDLRPGLPWQMVEIHEPVRLLFVVETSVDAMKQIVDNNPAIAQLADGEWVQLSVFDAGKAQVHRYVRGDFIPYQPESETLPVEESSLDWYRGWRDHLGFCSIQRIPLAPATSTLAMETVAATE